MPKVNESFAVHAQGACSPDGCPWCQLPPGEIEIDVRGLMPEVAKMFGQAARIYFREPENIAGLAGAAVLPLIVFRRPNVPFLLFFAVALVGDQAARLGYRAANDLHEIAAAARARAD